MNNHILLIPIALPLSGCVFIILFSLIGRGKKGLLSGITTVLFTLANLIICFGLYSKNFDFSLPWAGYGFEFTLRLYHFNSFIIMAVSGFAFLVSLYSSVFMKDKERTGQFYSYFLLTLSCVNGAVLADNLILLLFFWESLLVTLFGLIAIGREGAFKAATKAFLIVGISDLCMMFGIALTAHLSGSFTISKIILQVDGLGALAFVFLMIGAISKAGSMPFHSWIPDAAENADLPFMAFLPASLEKLLGIYFLSRITIDMFKFSGDSWLSYLLMTIGAITILLAVLMALIQKDYKKLLSYHAISQVGYMVLGIGTGTTLGIIGGLFHMINHAMYKSCLFLTGGAVERQAGTTDLEALGGLARKMPVTFICFFVAAASICGVPPFNGFFSKEMVYSAALSRGSIFYIAAILGSFFTAASFLKLGHSAYFGPLKNKSVKDAPAAMLIPMIVIAVFCVLFGLCHSFPVNRIILPVLGEDAFITSSENSGAILSAPMNTMLIVMTLIVLGGALLNHLVAVKVSGTGYKASDHIHETPFFKWFYSKAELDYFDPYNVAGKIIKWIAMLGYYIDRGIDWFYEKAVTGVINYTTDQLRKLHTGYFATYVFLTLIGIMIVIYFYFI